MYRTLEYTIFFLLTILLQAFLFNNLNISIYVYPMIYVSFIMLLPIQTRHILILLLGLITGVLMDYMSGTAGLHTIASLASAFCRPLMLRLIRSKEDINDGGIPNADRMGKGAFISYSSIFIFLHCFVFFSFEALSWNYFLFTLLRIAASTALTIPLVYFAQMLFIFSGYHKTRNT